MLDICNGHISLNIESLLTIFGGVIALRVLYKMGYINVVTSKMWNSMLTAALSGKVVCYMFVTIIFR